MKTVTKYISALGTTFDNLEDCLKDEDRLPSLIATYENDLARLVPGGEYAGKILIDNDDLAETRSGYQSALNRFKRKWAEVQAQRKAQ